MGEPLRIYSKQKGVLWTAWSRMTSDGRNPSVVTSLTKIVGGIVSAVSTSNRIWKLGVVN
jgi:hypothetical protein